MILDLPEQLSLFGPNAEPDVKDCARHPGKPATRHTLLAVDLADPFWWQYQHPLRCPPTCHPAGSFPLLTRWIDCCTNCTAEGLPRAGHHVVLDAP